MIRVRGGHPGTVVTALVLNFPSMLMFTYFLGFGHLNNKEAFCVLTL